MLKLLIPLLVFATSAEAAPVVAVVAAAAAKITVAGIISSVVSGIVASVIGGLISKAISGKSGRGGASAREDRGQLQTVFAGQAWVPHAYGESRVGAVVCDQFVTNTQGGQVSDTGEFAYAVYAIGLGEIDQVKQMYYYDIPIFASENPAFDTILSGSAISEKLRGQLRVEIKSGTLTQSRSQLLGAVTGQQPGGSGNRYTTNDVGTGVAYIVLEIQRDQQEGIISEATPTAITIDIRGRKVRDIRQAGSPFVYSANPALICLEELRDTYTGAGTPNENIDFYSFAEWANNCDTESFELHGRFAQGAKVSDIINLCEIHSDTDVVDANGVITARPNALVVGGTSIQINDNNIIDGLTRTEPATSEIFTVARVSYTTEEGVEALTIRQFDSDTIDQYGYRPIDIDFVMCKSKAQAEKLGARALVQQTLPQITGTMTKEGYEVGVADVCVTNFTFGDILPAGSRLKITGVDKQRVTSNTPIKFVARLYDDEVFTQQLNSIITPATVFSSARGSNDVPAPNVTNTPDVSNDNRVVIAFDNGRADLSLQWQISDDGGGNWDAFPGPSASASPVFVNLPNDIRTNWRLRFRFVNTLGIKGEWYETGNLNNTNKTGAFVGDSDGDLVVRRIVAGSLETVRITGTPGPPGADGLNIGDSELIAFSVYTYYTTRTTVAGLDTAGVNALLAEVGEVRLPVNNSVVQFIDDSDNPRTYVYNGTNWEEQDFAVDKAFIRQLTVEEINAATITADRIATGNYDSDQEIGAVIDNNGFRLFDSDAGIVLDSFKERYEIKTGALSRGATTDSVTMRKTTTMPINTSLTDSDAIDPRGAYHFDWDSSANSITSNELINETSLSGNFATLAGVIDSAVASDHYVIVTIPKPPALSDDDPYTVIIQPSFLQLTQIKNFSNSGDATNWINDTIHFRFPGEDDNSALVNRFPKIYAWWTDSQANIQSTSRKDQHSGNGEIVVSRDYEFYDTPFQILTGTSLVGSDYEAYYTHRWRGDRAITITEVKGDLCLTFSGTLLMERDPDQTFGNRRTPETDNFELVSEFEIIRQYR